MDIFLILIFTAFYLTITCFEFCYCIQMFKKDSINKDVLWDDKERLGSGIIALFLAMIWPISLSVFCIYRIIKIVIKPVIYSKKYFIRLVKVVER